MSAQRKSSQATPANHGGAQISVVKPKTPDITPEVFLREHELTLRLNKLGLTAAQLDGVSFRKHDEDAFSDWRVKPAVEWPISLFVRPPQKDNDDIVGRAVFEVVEAQRAWCTLRWLTLDNPPHSEDTSAAWAWLALYLARPIYKAGEKQLKRLADGRRKGSSTQKVKKDDEVLAQFSAWDTSPAARLVANKRPKDRVRVYIRVKQIKIRNAVRLRSLLREGKII